MIRGPLGETGEGLPLKQPLPSDRSSRSLSRIRRFRRGTQAPVHGLPRWVGETARTCLPVSKGHRVT